MKFSRILFSVLVTVVLSIRAFAMTNADVIKMTEAGLSTDVILAAVRGATERSFDTSVDGLIALKTAKVPDTVVAAMVSPSVPAPAVTAAPASEKSPLATHRQGCYFLQDVKLTRANALAAPLIRKSGRAEIPLAGIGGVPMYAWWEGTQASLTLKAGDKIVISGWDVKPEAAKLNVKDGKRYATITKRGKLYDPEKVPAIAFSRDEFDNYVATIPADLAPGQYWVFVDVQGRETPSWDFTLAAPESAK